MAKITVSFAILAILSALSFSEASPAGHASFNGKTGHAGFTGKIGITRVPIARRNIAIQDDAGIFNKTANRFAKAIAYTKVQTGLHRLQSNTGELLPGATLLPALNFTDIFGDLVGSSNDVFADMHRLVRRQKDPLDDQHDQLWTGSIEIGGQKFTIDFDTGSSDTFVPLNSCSNGCDNKNKYDPSKSSTSKQVGQQFKDGYGDGSQVNGPQFQDTVSVGGVSAQNQVFGAATQQTGTLAQSPGDGLMGLAFPALAQMAGDPWWINAFKQGAIKEQSFSMKLASSGSELFVGGDDKSMYTGELEPHKLTKQAYWQIGGASLFVNGQATGAKGFDTIIDSGTTLIYGPQDAVDALYKAIPGSQSNGDGTYSIPCGSLPKVAFQWDGGKQWEIDPQFLSLGGSRNSPQKRQFGWGDSFPGFGGGDGQDGQDGGNGQDGGDGQGGQDAGQQGGQNGGQDGGDDGGLGPVPDGGQGGQGGSGSGGQGGNPGNGGQNGNPGSGSQGGQGGSPGQGGSCVGAIQAQDLGLGNAWLVGDVFMRNVYTKFDGGANTVSFATLA